MLQNLAIDFRENFGLTSIQLGTIKKTNNFPNYFEVEMFRVTASKDKRSACRADATVKIKVKGKAKITSAEGKGPIDALDKASRKVLAKFFPTFDLRLIDFKVGIIGGRGTDAMVCVQIKSEIEGEDFYTAGVSCDIIEASWQALQDSYKYALFLEDKK